MEMLPEDNDAIKIEALEPGHCETYDLAANGKVSMYEKCRFHKAGEPPRYKTPEGPLGKYKYHI